MHVRLAPSRGERTRFFRAGSSFLLLSLCCAFPAAPRAESLPAARSAQNEVPASCSLQVTVTDENGVAVPSAHVELTEIQTRSVTQGETDFAGRWRATGLASGTYEVLVEKEGYFAVTRRALQIERTGALDITLNPQREYTQSVNVVYSPPAIDPTRTASRQELTNTEIIDLPTPVTRDIRYTLAFLPGVLQDGNGQLHIDGSSARQAEDRLDGFDVTGPASGLFDLRVSVDAVRSAVVEDSRIPAEFGKGSGGLIALTTGMGDDRLRYSATDFFPAIRSRRGLYLSNWNPRGTLSGPIGKGRAWFLIAPEGEYSEDVFPELPRGADRGSAWRFGNLAKAQVNIEQGNILTATWLENDSGASHNGLDRFHPLETTADLANQADYFALKDQAYSADGVLAEAGLALTRFHSSEEPLGAQTYVITPDGTRGNFYAALQSHSRRLEGIANVYLPPLERFGRHEIKAGIDLERVVFDESATRRPYEILRENGVLARRVTFAGGGFFGRNNFATSAYAEDRWLVSDRLTVEGGLRFDWDEIAHGPHPAPRLAASYLLRREGGTKLVGGVGVYYDRSNLSFLTRPLQGERTDYFYAPDGQSLAGPPAVTSFGIRPGSVRAPLFLNWSAGFEQRLPDGFYFRAEYLQRHGTNGWTYLHVSQTALGPASGPGSHDATYQFATTRHDRYDAVTFSVRKTFQKGFFIFASYRHSRARSNQVLDFSLDNPVFGPQVAGPLPWDSPDRFLSWSFLPLPHGFDLGDTLDIHSGFPFALVNEEQQLVAAPGARRFPTFFSLNLSVERRIHFFGFEWALRAGFDDITNRHNATSVDNNIDSPHFLRLGGLTGRALVARLRLLGRK
jgi:Carboxypeptidase regulatory-like domain